MAAIAIGSVLVAAGFMANEHRWLWGALVVWAGAIFGTNWMRGGYDDAASAAYHSAVIAALVLGPAVIGWIVGRLVHRARHDGPEWRPPTNEPDR